MSSLRFLTFLSRLSFAAFFESKVAPTVAAAFPMSPVGAVSAVLESSVATEDDLVGEVTLSLVFLYRLRSRGGVRVWERRIRVYQLAKGPID